MDVIPKTINLCQKIEKLNSVSWPSPFKQHLVRIIRPRLHLRYEYVQELNFFKIFLSWIFNMLTKF